MVARRPAGTCAWAARARASADLLQAWPRMHPCLAMRLPLKQRPIAAIAQLVEHVIRNDGVGGSIPSCGTKSQRVLPAQIRAGRVQGLLAVMSIGGFAAWRISPSALKALPSKPLLPAPDAHWPRPSCAEVRTVRRDSSADRPGCSWRLSARVPPKSWHGFRDWRDP